ncbi:patatin-like phospholipase family protein [Bdellovibrionota bacterium FG-2]
MKYVVRSHLTIAKLTVHLVLVSALLSACATTKRNAQHHEDTGVAQANISAQPTASPLPQPFGPPEAFGPPEPAITSSPTPENTYGPQPPSVRPIVLVLGPGAARGFASAGVIKALQEEKIPIGMIVGVEVGALIGALYATDGNINHFEWALIKFKADLFHKEEGLVSSLFETKSKSKRFEGALAAIFGTKDLSQFKIPMKLALQPKSDQPAAVIDHGAAVPNLICALGPLSKSRCALVELNAVLGNIREGAEGPIVYVNLSDMAIDASVDLILKPDLIGIGKDDFEKRNEAVFDGKKVVLKNRNALRALVGLSSDNPSDIQGGSK